MSTSSLAPGILIAAPPLGDPNFNRSVVLLASHDADGAFGWVMNGERVMSVAELLARADIDIPGEADSDGPSEHLLQLPGDVRVGGPVSPEQVWLTYPAAQRLDGVEEQLEVGSGILATASRRFLELLAEGAEVPDVVAFAGYAGWAPGQLEDEIKAGAWLPGDIRPELLFSTSPRDLWRKAFESLGTSAIAFTSRTVGSA